MKAIRNNLNYLFFIAATLVVYFFLDYHNILFLRPQGIHFIRQTDSLSFVTTYYKYGLNFFEPRILNLNSINGKTIGEFPILYYLTAIIYKIFGEHEFILRLVNLSIITTGLLFLYKLLLKILSDVVFALCFTFLFFSSTILIYYSNNFLPDSSALGFTLCGWYFFYVFFNNRKKTTSFILSLLFFTFASLLKVTYGLNLAAAILSLFIFDYIINHSNPLKKNTFYIFSFIISLLLIAAWYFFVIVYNENNNSNYFLTHIVPIWSINQEQNKDVWDHIFNFWYTKYYYESTIHVFIIIILAGIFFLNKSNKVILTFAITTAIGSVIYFILFFVQFKNHDYYFIAIIPCIIFLVINSFISIRNSFPKIVNNIFSKMALILLVILSLNYAREKLSERYDSADDKFAKIGLQLNNADKYMNSIGIHQDAKFIVVQDFTPNGSLYFINKMGWTISDTSANRLDKIPEYIQKGASFLLITNTNLLKNSSLKNLTKKVVGEYNNAVIYDLK